MLRRVAVLATFASALAAAPAAIASTDGAQRCRAADLRYGIQDGMPRDFGVWRLRVTGGSCTTAHRVARAFQLKLIQSPTGKVPRTVAGFQIDQLPPHAAQTYTLRATRGRTIVEFDEVVPNG